ncbi:MAG: 50S ribosomal protein L20 [Candidatus Andersenbacteria bacterium]
MPRASRSIAKRARHNKWLKRAKGFRGRRKSSFKLAKEAVLKAGQHAYYDRRKKRAGARARWHIAIGAAAKKHDLSYSKLMRALSENKIELDRKVLAGLAKDHPEVFAEVVAAVKK